MRPAFEDAYPLSPLQHGLLFHAVHSSEPGTYLIQCVCKLSGHLDVATLKEAWRHLVQLHPALRTLFLWKGRERPLQIVVPPEGLDWKKESWVACSDAEQESRLEIFLADDRRRGFDLAKAPPQRFALIELGPQSHRLVWSYHHAVLDGWSMQQLLREMLEIYSRLRRGDEPRLAAPATRPRDYVSWLRRQDSEAARRYWREALAGFDEPTPVGSPRQEPVSLGSIDDYEEGIASSSIGAGLRAFQREHGITPSTVSIGAWAMLLGRRAQRRDVVLGTTVALRPTELPDSERMVGVFINTVPHRVRMRRRQSLLELLQSIQEQRSSAQRFDHAPLSDVQGCSGLPAGTALFRSLLVFENYPFFATELLAGELVISEVRVVERSTYPLTIAPMLRGEELTSKLLYDRRSYDRAEVQRLHGHFVDLMEAMISRPRANHESVSLLSPSEQEALSRWSGTERPYPRDEPIPRLFMEQASSRPDGVALRWSGGTRTYRELDLDSNRLAHHLRRAGVRPGTHVGVNMERSPDLVTSLLGVLKAGGAYVPLPPSFPQRRLEEMVSDGQVSLVLSDRGDAAGPTLGGARILDLAAAREAIECESPRPLECGFSSSVLAYVLFTSGSTGSPKAVGVSHRSVVRLVKGTDYVHFGRDEVFCQLAPLSFDASTFELWGSLLNGASLVLPPAGHLSTAAIGRLFAEHAVSCTFLTTGLFNRLVDDHPDALGGLRQLLWGGEVASTHHARRALEVLGEGRLVHVYGPTEATTFSTYLQVEEVPPSAPSVPIGRPLPNTRTRVLDDDLRPVPVGVAGELYLGGDGLALGYLNDPGLTAERFVPDPFTDTPGRRLYRTGDRVCLLPDGTIDFLGRIDEQIKLRGFRIEPAEVERALTGQAGVLESLVRVWVDGNGVKRLVAYLVWESDPLSPAELRARLEATLPAFMIPEFFVTLEVLPLTATGKVDHRALPAPGGVDPARRSFVAPRTPVEEILTSVWTQALAVRVGVHDSFLDLGGNSLIAMQVVAQVRRLCDVDVPVSAVLAGASIAELAVRIEATWGRSPALRQPVARAPSEVDPVLSFGQERLLFLQRWEPEKPTYNVPIAFRIRGPLDVDRLERSLRLLAERHAALRTVFPARGGRTTLEVQPSDQLSFTRESLCHVPREQRDSDLTVLLCERARRPFALERDLPLRAFLVALDQEDAALLLSMHHIATDGWSVSILLRELSLIYAADGKDVDLPELSLDYADHAQWEREWSKTEEHARALDYWKSKLAGPLPVLDLPTDHARQAVRSARGRILAWRVPKEQAHALSALARREGVTDFMLLLAAYQVVLSRYTDSTDIPIGTPVANRLAAETEHVVGFFVNTIVIRSDLSGDPSFRQLLARVRKDVLEALARSEVPFARIVDELGVVRDPSRTPLVQHMFVLQDPDAGTLRVSGASVAPLRLDIGTAKFDLMLTFEQTPAGLEAIFEYDAALFDEGSLRRLQAHLATLLNGIVDTPDARISELPLMTAAERRAILEEWNSPAPWVLPEQTLPELFDAQVKRRPEALALTCDGQTLTYAQVGERANRLANRLRALGVGPQTFVGVFMERSNDLVVAILGVLKAGAAYVPLDPTYPHDRLGFMIADAGVSIVVADTGSLDSLPKAGHGLRCIDLHSPEVQSAANEAPDGGPSPAGPAYLIYTSGSTGRPKGVVVSHGNVVRLYSSSREHFRFDERHVWSMFHSYAFDVSVWEMWGAFAHGGRLVVVPNSVARDPEAFHDLLRQEGVSILSQTPSAFHQLMLVDRARAETHLDLQFIVFAGEELDPRKLRPWAAKYGCAHPLLVNMYGITETTVHSTFRALDEHDVFDGSGSPIGRPLGDLRIYVVDRRGRLAPPGVPGEMYVGGPGLATGYWRRPQLTAERFVPDGHGLHVGERLYTSGDMARQLPDGSLEFLGRRDHQVKLRGYRIELGEVEAALGEHPAVADCVAQVREDAPGDRRLVVYVAGSSTAPLSTSELREFLQDRLPPYMVPATFVLLDRLPLTPSGKVDRRALPAPSGDRPELTQGYVAPLGETERALAEIWSRVLGITDVGREDDFFALGGDSILSIQVLDGAKKLGIVFTLQQLFQTPTIAQLARSSERRVEPESARSATAPFSLVSAAERARMPPEVVDAYPLTALQTGMFYHMSVAPASHIYHCTARFHLRLPERFDAVAFQRAVDMAVARHPVFRTGFDFTHFDRPLQLVHGEARLEVPVHNIDHLEYLEQEALLEAAVDEERVNPFDPAKPTLLRFFIYLRSDREFEFIITEFHPIYDGWSYHSTIVEIFTNYRFLARGQEPPPAPELSLTFRDYVALELAALEAPEFADFWKRRLDGAPILRLPRQPGYPRPVKGPGIRRVAFDIPPDLYEGIRELARLARTPLKSVLLAAHVKVIGLITGGTDILTAQGMNGRPEDIEGERIRGLFITTVPFRQVLKPMSWLELTEATFRNEREIFPYRRYPLAAIQKDQRRGPLCDDVGFNFMDFHVYDELTPELGLEVLEPFKNDVSTEGTHFKLIVHVQQRAMHSQLKRDHLSFYLDYAAGEFSEPQIRFVRDLFLLVLHRMTARPRDAHDRFRILGDVEREQILERSRGEDVARPRQASVHQLLEENARLRPSHVALRSEGREITYRELDQRSNRLARHLQTLGVERGERVGSHLGRSVDAVVVFYAVLKAGGCYVPLDPGYPAERLREMVRDCDPRVIVGRSTTSGTFEFLGPRVVDLDHAELILAGLDPSPPETALDPRDLAYLLYTSGSTGTPKGVLLEHRGLGNLAECQAKRLQLEESSRVLQFASLSFDASIFEFVMSCRAGAELHVANPEVPLAGVELQRVLETQEITHLTVPPSSLRALPEGSYASLRTIVAAGEACDAQSVSAWHRNRTFVNAYGPTEATVWSTAWIADSTYEEADGDPPIGRPIENTSAYVLDERLEPVPDGMAGELYIGGVGLARGYWRRAALTAERFVPDPFTRTPGSRLYRTGDLARRGLDGQLEFLGRMDHQVKVRGFRIELGEIEAAILRLEHVSGAAVLLRSLHGGEAQLVAFLTLRGPGPLDVASMRHFLQERLPSFMVPTLFERLEHFPTTPSGKIDRRALAEREVRPPAPDKSTAPREGLERSIATVWKDVLGLEEVGANSNFFDLGGDSLSLVRLQFKLQELLAREIPVAQLFECPTIASLAVRLGADANLVHASGDLDARAAKGNQALRALGARARTARRPTDD
jgi:amino acid adenylation domain-containing protein